jgi:hypothetical protein
VGVAEATAALKVLVSRLVMVADMVGRKGSNMQKKTTAVCGAVSIK